MFPHPPTQPPAPLPTGFAGKGAQRPDKGNALRPFYKKGPEGRLALRVSSSLAYQTARAYRLVRPRMARERVISSVYSRSLPTGMPWAMRLTRSPKGLSSRAM